MRMALIKTGAMGDVVRTTALLPGLRRRDPGLELTWITAPRAIELIEDHPDVARAVSIDEAADAPWRRQSYDWVLCLDDGVDECPLASSLAAGRLSGGCLASDGTLRYTDDVAPWFGMGLLRPEEQGGLDRANALKKSNRETFGAMYYRSLDLPGPVARPFVPLRPARLAAARSWLAGAGGRWRFKSWGEAETAVLARRLADEIGAAVVVFGGPAERARNGRIVAAAGRRRVVATPTDLGLLEFAALIDRCDVLVTSDSLALHLGIARGRRVVVFFGPTSEAEIDLYGRGEKVITPLDCRCCYLSDCSVRPHCMQSISIDDLLDAVARVLAMPPVGHADPAWVSGVVEAPTRMVSSAAR